MSSGTSRGVIVSLQPSSTFQFSCPDSNGGFPQAMAVLRISLAIASHSAMC